MLTSERMDAMSQRYRLRGVAFKAFPSAGPDISRKAAVGKGQFSSAVLRTINLPKQEMENRMLALRNRRGWLQVPGPDSIDFTALFVDPRRVHVAQQEGQFGTGDARGFD